MSVDYARAVLDHRFDLAEDLAAEAGLTATRLYAHQKFAANVRLYAGLGYAVEREERQGDGGVAVHMVKGVARAVG